MLRPQFRPRDELAKIAVARARLDQHGQHRAAFQRQLRAEDEPHVEFSSFPLP